jgi:hypothetical protein
MIIGSREEIPMSNLSRGIIYWDMLVHAHTRWVLTVATDIADILFTGEWCQLILKGKYHYIFKG